MKTVLIAGVCVLVASLLGLWFLQLSPSSVPAAGPAAAGRTVLRDLVGREVRINRDIRRIVLPRSKDIYLLAVLLGDELPDRLAAWGPDLAIDDVELHKLLLARFPRLKDIPLIGSVYADSLNPEQILQLKPDLVILDKFMLDRGYKYTERLEAAGLPLVYLDSSNDPLTGPQQGIRLLGDILGKTERARAIVEFIDNQIRRVVSRIETNATPAPSVYIEAGHMGPGEYGQTYGEIGLARQQTSWGAILRALKVQNIAEGKVVGMAPIHPEALLKANPDIIVITGQNWSRWKTPGGMQLGFNVRPEEARRLLRGFTTRAGWDQLAAVKNRRLHAVFHNTVSPTVFSAIQALARDFYPKLFEDLDPEKNLREFYTRFMPLPYQGTWMNTLE